MPGLRAVEQRPMQGLMRVDAAEVEAMRRTTSAQLARRVPRRRLTGGRGVEPDPGYRATRLPLGVRGLYCYWRTGAGVIGCAWRRCAWSADIRRIDGAGHQFELEH
jgi:hypothetical protein